MQVLEKESLGSSAADNAKQLSVDWIPSQKISLLPTSNAYLSNASLDSGDHREIMHDGHEQNGLFGGGESVLSSLRASHAAAATAPTTNTPPSTKDAADKTSDPLNSAPGNQALRIAIPGDILDKDGKLFSPSDLPASATSLSGGFMEDASPTGTEMTTASPTKRHRSKAHTPRPSNSFILYRREKHVEIMAQYKGGKTLNNNVISKIVANMWRSETPDVKALFAAKAEAEKREHMLKYPDYKYRPKKSPSKAAASPSKSATSPNTTTAAPRKQSLSTKKNSKKSNDLDTESVSKEPLTPSDESAPIVSFPAHYSSQPYLFANPYAFPPGPHHYPIHIIPASSTPHHHMAVLQDGELGTIHSGPFDFGTLYEPGQDFFPHPSLLPPDYAHMWPGSNVGVVWESNGFGEGVQMEEPSTTIAELEEGKGNTSQKAEEQ